MFSLTPERIIQLVNLEPLPVEGGFYRRTYTAAETLDAAALPGRCGRARSVASAIYYLLAAGEFSALHRLQTDEIYHFYLGDPIELYLLYPGGGSAAVVLGPDLEGGQMVQPVTPRGVWQGSRLRPGGRFALLGTTLAPAFDEADFELGNRRELPSGLPRPGPT